MLQSGPINPQKSLQGASDLVLPSVLRESRSVNVQSRGLAFLEASVQLPEAFPPARVIQVSSTRSMEYSEYVDQ